VLSVGRRFGMAIAQFDERVVVLKVALIRSHPMADTKQKIKDKIDAAADKAKDLTEKAVDKSKQAAKDVGQNVKDAGQKIKDQGK